MKKIIIATFVLSIVTISSISAKDSTAQTYKIASSYYIPSGGSYRAANSSPSNWKEDYTNSLIMNNVIRKASNGEIVAWIQKAQMNSYPTQHMMKPGYTYVVQKSFNIPKDFCYNHYINFIIPDGAPEPVDIQNCGFYFLQNGCRKDKILGDLPEKDCSFKSSR